MSLPRFARKTVLITGGSRGIGAGITSVFAREGANVVFCSLQKHMEPGIALAADLNSRGYLGRVHQVEADLTAPGAVSRVVGTALKEFGQLDCLVNNAGWHPPPTPIDHEDSTAESFRQLLEINLVAPWLLARQTLPHLRRTKGSIINIGSLSGYFGQQGSAGYCATKAGLTGMSRGLAIDEAPFGVRVNTISPGNVWTPLWAEHVQGPTAAEDIQAGKNAQLLGRMGTIEEVGEACLHLAAEATYTTGIEYILSGGAELGYSRKYAVKTPEELDEALDLERTRKKGEKWLSVPAD